MRKKGLQLNFAWIFAIIVGGIILFLAIFASTKIIKNSQFELDKTTAKRIDVLLNPLQTGFESSKVTSISLPSETRIHNQCSNEKSFGKQYIGISQKSFGKDFPKSERVGFENKYLFSEEFVEGKKFYVFSKNFEFPFKVSSVIYLTSAQTNYCFVNAPDDVNREINNLKLSEENLFTGNCPKNSIKICFGQTSNECDIQVKDLCSGLECENEFDKGVVEKNKKRVKYFGKSLMYGAIFSEPEIYECQVKRLMQRLGNLALVYYDESKFVSSRKCNTGIESDLLQLNSLSKNFKNSENLEIMEQVVENIDSKNKGAICKLW